MGNKQVQLKKKKIKFLALYAYIQGTEVAKKTHPKRLGVIQKVTIYFYMSKNGFI